ncbi:hypothetical protein ACOSQ2_019212 [Xanthoceras sorbifolium]
MSNLILKDAGLSGISNSSSSSGLRSRRANELHPITMVTATGVIDLDPKFREPATRVVDDAMERASVGEASTSGAVALMVRWGFFPVGLSPQSVNTYSNLLRIRFQYGIPDSCTDSMDDDWVCFYDLPFKQSLRCLVPYLIRQLLALLDMTPDQLMPNSWRLLLSIEVLYERRGLSFTLANFLHTYYVKSHEDEPGRYLTSTRPNRPHLITDLTTNDCYWKNIYFFCNGGVSHWSLRGWS